MSLRRMERRGKHRMHGTATSMQQIPAPSGRAIFVVTTSATSASTIRGWFWGRLLCSSRRSCCDSILAALGLLGPNSLGILSSLPLQIFILSSGSRSLGLMPRCVARVSCAFRATADFAAIVCLVVDLSGYGIDLSGKILRLQRYACTAGPE